MAIKKIYYNKKEYCLEVKTENKKFHTKTSSKKVEIQILKNDPYTFLLIDKKPYKVKILENNCEKIILYIFNFNKTFTFQKNSPLKITPATTLKKIRNEKSEINVSPDTLKSPLAGKVIKINVKKGDLIKKDQSLVVIESMKMENDIRATQNAFVKNIQISVQDLVQPNQVLITFEKGRKLDGKSKNKDEKKEIQNR